VLTKQAPIEALVRESGYNETVRLNGQKTKTSESTKKILNYTENLIIMYGTH